MTRANHVCLRSGQGIALAQHRDKHRLQQVTGIEPHTPSDPSKSGEEQPLAFSGRLVGEVGDVAIDGFGTDEAHGFRVARLAKEALPSPEHNRIHLQPQLVHEVVFYERAYELKTGCDDDFSG